VIDYLHHHQFDNSHNGLEAEIGLGLHHPRFTCSLFLNRLRQGHESHRKEVMLEEQVTRQREGDRLGLGGVQ
jgi:hypothetical protein